MDDPLLTVDLDNLTFATLVGTTDNHDFVVLANRDRANTVLFTELLGERSAHDLATNIGGGGEVSLSALTARRTDVYMKFRLIIHPSSFDIIRYNISIHLPALNFMVE